jgi:peroxiredoxin
MKASLDKLYKAGVSQARQQVRLSSFLTLAVLLVFSLGINLLLARRVSSLKNMVTVIKAESSLVEGDKVPPLAAKDPQGQNAVFDYSRSKLPTVVFVITPTCGWCTKNIMNMRALVEKASDRFQFVGFSLSSDKLHDYLTANKLDFPFYTDLPLVPTSEYKLGGTPQTIVVSPSGEVMKVWSGAFAEKTQKEVEDYFGVSLPGLMDPQKTD